MDSLRGSERSGVDQMRPLRRMFYAGEPPVGVDKRAELRTPASAEAGRRRLGDRQPGPQLRSWQDDRQAELWPLAFVEAARRRLAGTQPEPLLRRRQGDKRAARRAEWSWLAQNRASSGRAGSEAGTRTGLRLGQTD